MKPNLAFSLCTIYMTISLVSCKNPGQSPRLKGEVIAKAVIYKKTANPDSAVLAIRVYAKGDSSCAIINNQTLCISKKYPIDLKNAAPFIYQVKNGVITKSSWLTSGHLTFISILEDTGLGHTELYVIDDKTNALVKDKTFKRDYLSGFGIFVINGNKIFTMHKYYYNEKNNMPSAGSSFYIKNNRFIYLGSRVSKTEIDTGNTAVINFSELPLNKKF